MTQPIKNAQEHLASLKDGRSVYLDGKKVDDVTTHPAFANAVQSAANLYEFQSRPENVETMTFESPKTGRRVNRAWQMPTTYQELVTRRKALVAWAEQHGGFMGRSPSRSASPAAVKKWRRPGPNIDAGRRDGPTPALSCGFISKCRSHSR